MRIVSLLLCLTFLSQGCSSTVRGRQQTVDFSERWVRGPKRLMYCGSDKQWHHFTARPIDSFVFFEVDRQELSLIDERPYTGDDLNFYYAVDPARGFEKMSD